MLRSGSGWHRESAEGSAGPDRDDGKGVLHGLLQHGEIGLAGDHRIDAIVLRGHRAVDHDEIFAFVFLHRLAAGRLRGVARNGHQRVMIVERDEVEDQIFERRAMGTRQKLRASRAFLEGQPDHRLAPRLGESLRQYRRRRGRQRHQGGEIAGIFEKGAPRNAASGHLMSQGVSLAHMPSPALAVFRLRRSNPGAAPRRRRGRRDG